MPKKKAASKRTSTKVNKSEWIRNQARTMSAKEVREKAAAEGITLSLAQIYTARSSAKKAGGGAKAGPRRGPGVRAASARSGSKASDDLDFRRLVLSIGLPAAEAYLTELKRSVGL